MYFGIHPVDSNGTSTFIKDIYIKLDSVAPTLSVSQSTTSWTNKDITLTATASDDMNIIETYSFYDKNNNISTSNIYSKPKILILYTNDSVLTSTASFAYNLKNKNQYSVTTKLVTSSTTVNDLKGYDIVVWDNLYWATSNTISALLNSAFDNGISIFSAHNDYISDSYLVDNTSVNHSGQYTYSKFLNNNNPSEYLTVGRSDRFTNYLNGVTESDSNYYTLGSLKSGVFKLAEMTTSDTNTKAPAVLYKTGTNGNKWIHVQKAQYVNVFAERVIDELMHGKSKTRQSYSKSYTISENGTYKIEVSDFSGNKTSKTITVSNIDKTAPVLTTMSYNKNWATSVTYSFEATDSGSGVSYYLMPDGSKVYGTNATYTFTANGTYDIKIYDNAGNYVTKSITVSNVDTTISNINNLSLETSIDNSKTKLNVTCDKITDSQSGIKGYSYVLDKKPSTIPDNTVNTTSNTFTVDINSGGLYYLHIKALDNAGNVSNVLHKAIDIPNLTVTPNNSENYVRLDWTMNDLKNKLFKVYQKKETGTTFESISTTNFESIEKVNVLNIYPGNGENITFTTWDGETCTLPKSASLKKWMEEPNSENSKGYGKGIIEVTPVTVDELNKNPELVLKNNDGSWKYDVIMLGSWDTNGGKIPSNEAIYLISDFIDSGRGFLAGHDTIGFNYGTTQGLGLIRDKFNIKVGYWSNSSTPTDEGHHFFGGFVSTKINVRKTGLLTNYPWNIGDLGTQLTVPNSHSTSNFAYGDIWMTYPEGSLWNGTNIPTNLYPHSNFYLTTWNNTAMIQTGHSNGQATPDEQKLLANTLFYLNQLSVDNYLNDRSGQDVKAPNKPTISNLNYDGNGYVSFTIDNVADNGSTYQYYVQAEDTKTNVTTVSQVETTTVTTGIKGYSYVIDNKPTTEPDNTIEITSSKTIKIQNNENNAYIHIKAIDNAGNVSEVLHYKLSDVTAPTLTLTPSTTNWTNGSVTITAKAVDNQSGVKEIILPNGNIVSSTNANFTVTQNGVYYFKAIDNMGNETISSVTITNIDKNKPTVVIHNNYNGVWTNQNVNITITATDN